MQLKFTVILSLILFNTILFGQWDEIKLENEIYVDYIKSVQFGPKNNQLSAPILNLNGSNGRLELTFDDLDGDFYDYKYQIIHCDKDWNKSNLQMLEYLDGYTEEYIRTGEVSSLSLQNYTTYTVSIPNRRTRLKISGNYVLVILDEEDLPIITRRFIVFEPLVIVNTSNEKPTDNALNNTHQGISVEINQKNFKPFNPMQNVSVTLMQNLRWDNAVYDLKPIASIGDRLRFPESPNIAFLAGKEFRSFDIRSLITTSRGVHSIILEKNSFEIILELQKSRNYRDYIDQDEPDFNGGFYIDNTDSQVAKSGEYCNVTFALEKHFIEDASVYFIGQFTDWKLRPENKMEYSPAHKSYVGNALLKQGIYNYQYVVVEDSGNLDFEALEGSFYKTENDYDAIVYYSDPDLFYDRIIGIGHTNSLGGTYQPK